MKKYNQVENPRFKRRNIVGKLVDFRGLVYAPVNENGVIFLFSKITKDLNLYIETIRTGFPDCIAKRYIGHGQWEEVRIEFEFAASNFVSHKHNPADCDMIVCWENDWSNCPKHIEILELKSIIGTLENEEIKEPDRIDASSTDLTSLFKKYSPQTKRQALLLEKLLIAEKKKVWRKVHKRGFTFYSPEKVFVYVDFQSSGLRYTLFTGGKPLKGVDPVDYDNAGIKWGRMWVENEDEVKKSIPALLESCRRLNDAIVRHENTGWYAEMEK